MSHTETSGAPPAAIATARERLDAHVREIVKWHFDPATGCPFWLERAKGFDFNPRTDVQTYEDLIDAPSARDRARVLAALSQQSGRRGF